MKGDVRVEDATLPGGRFQFPFIGSVRTDLFDDELTASINAVLGGSKIDFAMAVSQLANPQVAFDLTTDNLDLSTLFPPPVEPAPRAVSDGEETEPQAAPEAKPEAAEPPAQPARQFDWSFLESAHVQGNIKAKALKAGGVELQGLEAAVLAEEGVLQVHDIRANLYGGSLESNVSLSAQHEITLDLSAVSIDIRPLAQALMAEQRLTGTGDFQIALSTQGQTMPALISALGGNVRANVRNGAWIGLNLDQTIAEMEEVLRNTFSGQLPEIANRFDPSRRTTFESLNIDLALNSGQGQFTELDLESPSVHVKGGEPASIDLVNRQLDVVLHVTPQASADNTQSTRSILRDIAIPVRVTGSFDDPAYKVQWQEVGHRAVKEAIQEGLLDILSGSSGQGGGSLLLPLPDKSEDARRDPLKSLGNTLKGLLGQ